MSAAIPVGQAAPTRGNRCAHPAAWMTRCVVMKASLTTGSELGAEVAADILDKLADAHLKLSEGQGAELLWRDAKDKSLTALDALKIYALKTSPAFEAALYSGLRLAGPSETYDKMVVDFSRH